MIGLIVSTEQLNRLKSIIFSKYVYYKNGN